MEEARGLLEGSMCVDGGKAEGLQFSLGVACACWTERLPQSSPRLSDRLLPLLFPNVAHSLANDISLRCRSLGMLVTFPEALTCPVQIPGSSRERC